MESIGDALNKMRSPQGGKVVTDWRKLLPPGSRWTPGDPGNPACKKCEGTGFVRIGGLSVTHPNFGKIFLCECVDMAKYGGGAR